MKKIIIIAALFTFAGCKKDEQKELINKALFSFCDSVFFVGDSQFWGNNDLVSIPRRFAHAMDKPESMYPGIAIPGASSTTIADSFQNRKTGFGMPLIIWVGANNKGDHETVKADLKRIIGSNSRFIVFEIVPGDIPATWKGAYEYEWCEKLNNDIEAMVGKDHFYRVKDFLQKYTKTKQDSIDVFEHGVVPSSLRLDIIHMNNEGNDKSVSGLLDMLTPCNSKY